MRPVAAVVRAHRQLVDEDAVRGVEELDREQADDTELAGHAQRRLLRGDGMVVGQARGGGDDLAADPVDLEGLDDGVGDGLARTATGRRGRRARG